jgi:hypothetical protein
MNADLKSTLMLINKMLNIDTIHSQFMYNDCKYAPKSYNVSMFVIDVLTNSTILELSQDKVNPQAMDRGWCYLPIVQYWGFPRMK